MAVRPPVEHLKKLAANRIVLGIGYALCLVGAGLVIHAINRLGPIDELYFRIGMGCAGGGMLSSLLIFWRKPRSRHHTMIMVIISLLVLVFGSVYYIEQFEDAPHDDTQGPTRY